MIKKSLYFLLTISFIYANEIDFNITSQNLQAYDLTLPRNVIVDDSSKKESFKKIVFFAKNYYDNNFTKQDKENINFLTLNYLYNKSIENFIKAEKLKITDDIAYSYYISNKSKFLSDELIDLHVLTFDTLEDAKAYKIDTNFTKKFIKAFYQNIKINSLYPEFKLLLNNLDINTLSKAISFEDKIIRVYYTNIIKSKYIPYDIAKNNIINYLVNEKINDIIKSNYKIYNEK